MLMNYIKMLYLKIIELFIQIIIIQNLYLFIEH